MELNAIEYELIYVSPTKMVPIKKLLFMALQDNKN